MSAGCYGTLGRASAYAAGATLSAQTAAASGRFFAVSGASGVLSAAMILYDVDQTEVILDLSLQSCVTLGLRVTEVVPEHSRQRIQSRSAGPACSRRSSR